GGGDDNCGAGRTMSCRSVDGGGSVGAVDDDLESGQRTLALGVEAVHEVFGVFIGRGRIAGDASDRGPGRTLPVLIEDLEDGVLDGVVEFRAAGGEEFDPVVGHRVV